VVVGQKTRYTSLTCVLISKKQVYYELLICNSLKLS
jgi:hypothetical protein